MPKSLDEMAHRLIQDYALPRDWHRPAWERHASDPFNGDVDKFRLFRYRLCEVSLLATAPPFPLDPLAFEPHQHPPHRPPQEGNILREQQGAERHHPQPKDGQEAEEASGNEENPDRDANPAGRGSPQQSQKARSGVRELLFEPIELTIESLIVPSGHSVPPLRR